MKGGATTFSIYSELIVIVTANMFGQYQNILYLNNKTIYETFKRKRSTKLVL